MTDIRKIYLISHTHTDLGYTDHVDSVLLHHRDILIRAIEVCEESFDAPEGAQHRWTCEVTSTTLDWLRHARSDDVDRFIELHRAGRIAVGALRFHWTPLVSPRLAARTLRDVDELRETYGVTVRSAMQCDVNGLAWFWNDLLQARGITFLSTHQNPHRGYWGKYVPSVWRWEGRQGGSMLVHQGEHYGQGGFMALGRSGSQDRAWLFEMLERHAASPDWPLPFSVINVTNAANGDNVFPEPHLTKAVLDWNQAESVPMEIITIDQLGDLLAEAANLPTWQGEWMDSWVDGVASTPLETAAARAAERLLPIIEDLGGASRPEFNDYVDALALYNEHTWGAHSAVTAPDSIFTVMQQVQKSNHAFRALAGALRLSASLSREQAEKATGTSVEGNAEFADASHADHPDEQTYLIANSAPDYLEVDWPVPIDRGAGPRIGIPQAYGCAPFFPGIDTDGWTDALLDSQPSGSRRLRANLDPHEAALSKPVVVDTSACAAGDKWIENEQVRITLDAVTGGIAEWIDKTHDMVLTDPSTPLLAPRLDVMIEGRVHRDIFKAPYWERANEPMRWNADPLFEQRQPLVKIAPGRVTESGAEISSSVTFPGGIRVQSVIRVAAGSGVTQVTAEQDARGHSRPFSLSWTLGFANPFHRWLADTGEGLIDALTDHLLVSSRRWQSVQSGVAKIADDGSAVTIAALDTPLFQPGGPWTSEPFVSPDEAATATFWSINNHWDTNFADRVHYLAPARFRLSYVAAGGIEAAQKALRRATAMPIIVRAPFAESVSADVFWPDKNGRVAD